MSWSDRILNDGNDREAWRSARIPVIGASDAKTLAKPQSVHLYLASKLSGSQFTGNEWTASGHRWEPMMLAWAGIPENKALVHTPGERGFAATPDGIGDGVLAECKAKHGRTITGPNLGEWRQIAWQLMCIPEAEYLDWIWVHIVDGDLVDLEPRHIRIPRDHPKVIDLQARVLPIATDLLSRLTASLAFEKEMNAA